MDIQQILEMYARSPQSAALARMFCDCGMRVGYVDSVAASVMPVLFASVSRSVSGVCVIVLDDAEEAGYFYHDMTQMLGTGDVLFFPSSYRRRIKYGQHDQASEILRTEVLGRLLGESEELRVKSEELIAEGGETEAGQKNSSLFTLRSSLLYIVTCPEALSELVVSRKKLDERTVILGTGESHDITLLARKLRELGFTEVDYVYEPGQFAVRGSILDVFSYSSEYPFRLDFFGDEIDSIRTFEVQSQLSRDRRERVEVVPEVAQLVDEKVSFLSFLPAGTVLAMKDFTFCREKIDGVYRDGFTSQAVKERLEGLTEMEQQAAMKELKAQNTLLTGAQFASEAGRLRRIEFGAKPAGTPDAVLRLDVTPQPLFHKNFDLLAKTMEDYILKGYTIYILADSRKQNERLREILESDEISSKRKGLVFTPVDKTLHAGFADNTMKACFFTDHQAKRQDGAHRQGAARDGTGRLHSTCGLRHRAFRRAGARSLGQQLPGGDTHNIPEQRQG